MRLTGLRGVSPIIGAGLVLGLVLALFGRVQGSVAAACDAPTKVWDGGAGTSSWMDKANWNGDTLPTLTDDVCISGADVTVTATGGNAIARSFEVVAGRTLTVDGTLQPNGPAESLVNARAALAVSGILTGAGGTSPLRIEGSMDVSASSQITLPTTNAPGGVITKSSAGTSTFSGTFANAGSMAVNAGTLRLNQATGSSSGSVVIAAGAVLSHTSGAFTYGPTASITGTGDLTVAGAAVTLSAGTTYGLDAFIVSVGTLTLNQAYTIPTVTMTGGVINGPADLTVTSALTMSGGPVMAGGAAATTTIAPSASATLSVSAGTLFLGRTLSIASGATATIDGNGAVVSGGGGIGSIINAGSLVISGNSQTAIALTNQASASITKTSTGTTTLSNTFTNAGSVAVDAGILRLTSATGTSSGSVVIAAGAVLSHASGAFTYGPTASIAGAGDLTVAGATVTLSAGTRYDLDAFQVTAGTLTLNDSYTIPTVTLTGAAINGPGQLTVSSVLTVGANSVMGGGAAAVTNVAPGATAMISLASGNLSLSRTLSFASRATASIDGNGTITSGGFNTASIVNGGSLAITGNSSISVPVTNQATGTITKSSSGTTTLSAAVANNGDVTVADGLLNLTGSFTNYNQATDVLAGGSYHVRGTLRFVGADIVTNQAAIILDGVASLVQDGSGNDGFRNFTTNTGTLTITSGRSLTLPKALTSTGAITVGAASTLAAPSVTLNGGTLSGNGTVAAPVSNGGRALPGSSPGILTIAGSYTQTAAGSLDIEIGGAAPGTGYDQLNVTGPATLDGTLRLSTTPGFAPTIGQTFTILTYASHTGCFTTIDGRDLAAVGQGMFFDVSCGPTSAVVTTRRAEISIDDAAITEGNGGQQAMTFTISQNVTRPDVATSVDFATADGSATSPADYAAGSGTLTFTAGDISLTRVITVDVEGDLLDEFDEAFSVNLSNVSNAYIAFGSGAGTIVDDDPPPTVTIDDPAVIEGDSGTTAMAFKVDLSAPSGKVITIDYVTSDGNARAPGDYGATSGSLSFNPGETSRLVTVDIVGDLLDEEDESFTVDLSNPSNVTIADGSGTGTILDNDPPPTVSISDVTIAEGDSGTSGATLTVSLSGPSGKPISVDYATVDGTAFAPEDYVAASGTLTFAPGLSFNVIALEISGDSSSEADESFAVVLTNPTNVTIQGASGTITIVNDDLAPISVPLAAGFAHTCALTTAGGVKCWGDNSSGQLGNGTTSGRVTAETVATLSSGVVAIAAGFSHSCALTITGGVKCWGLNDSGQLGDGTTSDRVVPVDVANLSSGVVAITAGGIHTCALMASGGVRCWGHNASGQLGDGTNANRLVPVGVVSLSSGVATIVGGGSHTCAITMTGTLKCWGDNISGQLGDGSMISRWTPVTVANLAIGVRGAAAGSWHTCAITSAGEAKCWGRNVSGQLGDGTTTDRSSPSSVLSLSSGVAAISGSWGHTCALTTGGGVKCWGDNSFGQLGDSNLPISSLVPVDVSGLSSGVLAIAAGGHSHTCALTINGPVMCWGLNTFGQLGDGTSTTRSAPVGVLGYGADLAVDDVTVTEGNSGVTTATFTVTLTEPTYGPVTVDYSTSDGTATSGSDYSSATGTVTFAGGETTVHVGIVVRGDTAFEADESFTLSLSNATNALVADDSGTATIANDDLLALAPAPLGPGWLHTCAVTPSGGVKCWGFNGSGQLGDGTTSSHLTAQDVQGLTIGVVAIASGLWHTCALSTAGGVTCWGANVTGQLGDGTTTDRHTPVGVSGLSSGVVAITAGVEHTCALSSTGGVTCWGQNGSGQLGDGTTTERHTPVAVSGLSSGAAAIEAGDYHTCAVTIAGGAKCWGNNFSGQLGDGTTTSHPTPVDVQGLSSGIAAIAAGEFHTCALSSADGVTCWGYNFYGQLGDGTTTDRHTPVGVLGLSSGVVAIASGLWHTCALSTAGGATCWGNNFYGQLGDGTTTSHPTPVDVQGLSSGVVAISAGRVHTCALTSTGQIMCWGENDSGQLGNGTTGDRYTPVAVIGYGSDLSIDDVTITEGDTGTTQASFTVTLSVPSSATVTVGFATAGESALAGEDYTALAGTLTFVPGDTSEQILIDIAGDTSLEPDETFRVDLFNATNAAIADLSGTATITNDDVPSLSVDDVSVTEGSSGTTPATFSVTLSAPSAVNVTVNYATADGTATSPADYAAASGTLTFAPGEITKPIAVNILGDTLDEPDEAYAVILSSPSNTTIGDGSGTGTIADDDSPPTISIGDQAVVEGDTGTTAMTFTVVLSVPSGRAITVDYATTNGTATAPADYTATSGTLTFAPGDTSEQVTVAVRGDTLDESNETFSVNLSNPSAAVIADGIGTGTITDDDPKATITSLSPASVPQGGTLTIRGTGLMGTTQVSFARAGGGTVNATTFRIFSDTRLTATVPVGATTGRVSVTTANGIATSPSDLLIEPRISNFAPRSGPVGTVVTITGSGFSGVTTVRFGGTAAAFTATSDTQITAIVPTGASTGKITIVTPGGSDTSMGKFTVQ